ncbi:MAG: GerMN domain-containing protein [Lachnospiraceae bacterium]|nr:GerMN domain-containing protein [Lachnospiraceae bacterium]MBP3477607.1 GerMN domain-containing protein [Lachnospiraceae bacterium]
MNKRMKITLAAVAAMFIIAACSNAAENTTTVGENVVPEASSGEMLVDGLEYLLSEDKEDIIQIPDAMESVSDTESEEADTIEEFEDIPTDDREADTEQVELILYYSNGTFDSLDSDLVEAEKLTAETLISALSRHNIVSLDTKVLSFEEEEIVGGKILHLDLSKAIDEYLRTMTREAESIIIASITDTFLENYKADSIYITVDGEPLTTPYAVYDEPLKKCMPQDLIENVESVEEEEKENGRD